MTTGTTMGPEGLEMTDAQGVSAGLRRWVPLGARLAQSWAEAGRIVGRGSGAATLYPVCQFDTAGLPQPVMQAVIAALGPSMTDEEIVGWLATPRAGLRGKAPAELLASRPDLVRGEALRLSASGRSPRAA